MSREGQQGPRPLGTTKVEKRAESRNEPWSENSQRNERSSKGGRDRKEAEQRQGMVTEDIC